MAITPLRIAKLQQSIVFVDKEGRLTNAAVRALNDAFKSIVQNFNQQADVLNRLTAAEAEIATQGGQISDLTTEQQQAAAEQSIVNSGIIEVASPPMIRANSSGSITLSNHKRLYGNSTLNPTVNVTGGSLPSGMVAGEIAYVYYDDPARAGGAVSYAVSAFPEDAVQGGNRHSVGSVEIPSSGTQDGTYVAPPGVT